MGPDRTDELSCELRSCRRVCFPVFVSGNSAAFPLRALGLIAHLRLISGRTQPGQGFGRRTRLYRILQSNPIRSQ